MSKLRIEMVKNPEKTPQNPPERFKSNPRGLSVGKNWIVSADSMNIILYHRHVTKFGREHWQAHSYYSNPANALIGLVNQGVRDTKLADLKTVCDKIEELRRDIMEAIKNGLK